MVRVALAIAVAAALISPFPGSRLRAAGAGQQDQRLEFERGGMASSVRA